MPTERVRKSWKEKLLSNKGLPKVIELTPRMKQQWGKGTIAIPAPIEVDAIMKKVPKGKLITINQIREVIAKKHKATMACPITTGIFTWISAHAAEEEIMAGKKRVTPYWRTLKSEGTLNPKYPGGVELQSKRLKAEGHEIVKSKGKKPPIVKEYEKRLIRTSRLVKH